MTAVAITLLLLLGPGPVVPGPAVPVASPSGSRSAKEPPGSRLEEATEETNDLAALWREACLWEVGSNSEKVPAARRKLIEQGDRALEFLIPSKLETKDTLVTRALRVVLTGIGERAVPRLLPCLESDKPDVRRNAADLLGALGAASAAPAIAKLLADPDARLGALAALGELKTTEPVPQIAALMDSDAPERVRYTAAATLGALGGPLAERALARTLASPSAPLRYAAQFALEQTKAVETLIAALGDSDARAKLHAIAALGHIANPAAREPLRPLLDDPAPVVRGFAAEALGAMLDPATRSLLEARLATETDPFARGKLSSALGR